MKENDTAMQVLPDLLQDLDSMTVEKRLLALIQGTLAANIFDWGSRECVDRYQEGLILSIYRDARERLSQRPWRVDDFDKLAAHWMQSFNDGVPPYHRVMIFVDNAGADIVLGLLPLAREFLVMGSDVVLAANALPAINDVTADELIKLIEIATGHCEILKTAWTAGKVTQNRNKGNIPRYADGDQHSDSSSVSESSFSEGLDPPKAKLYVANSGQDSPCLDLRSVGDQVARAALGTDLVILEGMGRAVHTNLRTQFKCDCLKLAMIKNKHVASSLFGGNLFDCICIFDTKSDIANSS